MGGAGGSLLRAIQSLYALKLELCQVLSSKSDSVVVGRPSPGCTLSTILSVILVGRKSWRGWVAVLWADDCIAAFANDLVLLASSVYDLQHSLDWFALSVKHME